MKNKPWQEDPHRSIQSITNPEEICDWLKTYQVECEVAPCAVALFESGWELFWWGNRVGKVKEPFVRRN